MDVRTGEVVSGEGVEELRRKLSELQDVASASRPLDFEEGLTLDELQELKEADLAAAERHRRRLEDLTPLPQELEREAKNALRGQKSTFVDLRGASPLQEFARRTRRRRG